jgi:hypothetical protein
MRKRLFWLVNDFLYWLTRGRVDLDGCLTVTWTPEAHADAE